MNNILKKAKEHYEAHKEQAKEYDKQYREKNDDRLKEYDRARIQVRDQIKVNCPNCNCEIVKRHLNRHLQTQKCIALSG